MDLDGNNFCPQCNYEVTASTNRLIHDSCGHRKCRMCLMQEENGCITCLIQHSKQIKYEPVIIKANKPTSVERFIYEPSTDVTGSEEVKVITKLENYMPPECCPPIPSDVCDENYEVAEEDHQPIIEEPVKKMIVVTDNIKTSDTGTSNVTSKGKRKPLVIPSYVTVSDSPARYLCTICNKSFKARLHVRYHLYCDGSVKPYSCNICFQEFVSKSHYEYHLRNHEGRRPHVCVVCKKTFNQQGKLKRHMGCHSEDRPFVCVSCGRSFKDLGALRQHNRTHAEDKPFRCNLCPRLFTELANLKRHSVRHSGIKEFMCDECGKSFTLKCSLNVHILSHSPGRPFVCSLCPRSFTSNKSLKRHTLTHSNLQSFVCSLCNQGFRRKDNFDRHMKNTHPDSRLPPTIVVQSDNTLQLSKIPLSQIKPRNDTESTVLVPLNGEQLPAKDKVINIDNTNEIASELKSSVYESQLPVPAVHVPESIQNTATVLRDNHSNEPMKSISVRREPIISRGSDIAPPSRVTSNPAFQAVPVINRSNVSPNIRYTTSSIIKMGTNSNSIIEPTNCVSTITCTSNLRNNNVPTIVSPPGKVAVFKPETCYSEPQQKPPSPEPAPKPKVLRLYLSDVHWRKRTMEMLNLGNKLKADSLVYDKSLEKLRDSCEERIVLDNARNESPECKEFYSSPKAVNPDDSEKYSPNQTVYKVPNLDGDSFYREPIPKFTPRKRPRLIPPKAGVDEDEQQYPNIHCNVTKRADDTRLFTLAQVAEAQPQLHAKNVIVENRTQHVPGRGDKYVLPRCKREQYDSHRENDANC